MFSISKNPQASMAEVLTKAEKYINGEEALISKKESSSTHKKKKVGQTNDEDRAPKDKVTRKGLQRKMENGPQKGVGTSEIIWVHRNPKDDDVIRLSVSPP